ncbi:MAG TPA: EamA family transporter [Candidatus Onthomorpha intestinigallinarum]|uniref:EamA family transporter n=1 Tax=Candidatus Onthomorpha intestinigallinarum TaxID=2840880 RepID=A0A9D1RIA1_9BACT|nr:EamA family transporter [Candidatus Onthomorpha intestinigallinarum]
MGAVASANYIYLNPLSTCIFSAIFLGEQFTAVMIAGGLAIVAGLYQAVRR